MLSNIIVKKCLSFGVHHCLYILGLREGTMVLKKFWNLRFGTIYIVPRLIGPDYFNWKIIELFESICVTQCSFTSNPARRPSFFLWLPGYKLLLLILLLRQVLPNMYNTFWYFRCHKFWGSKLFAESKFWDVKTFNYQKNLAAIYKHVFLSVNHWNQLFKYVLNR